MNKLSATAAYELLRDHVYNNDMAGFVYVDELGVSGSCFYTPLKTAEDGHNASDPRTKTGCLIGSVLPKIPGMTPDFLSRLGETYAGIENVARESDFLMSLISKGALRVFSVAQGAQDAGVPWGKAVDISLRAVQS